jgi:hypothetical protein
MILPTLASPLSQGVGPSCVHPASIGPEARARLRVLVVLGFKTWLPAETLKGLRAAEDWHRGEVRLHHRILERFRETRGLER